MEKWKKKSVQVFTVAVIISVISAAPHKPTTFDSSYRLPKTVVPLSYELFLKSEVHLEGKTNFEGTVKIKIEIVTDTDVIILHSSGLAIEEPKIFYPNETIFNHIQSHTFDTGRDFLKIATSVPLIKNQTYFLEINFAGNLKTTTTSGFYRSQYQVAGETYPRFVLIKK